MVLRASVLMLSFLSLAAAAGAAEVKESGKIESVTLYRGRALVTRLVPVRAPAGAVQIVVGNLPEQVQPDSLYASVGDGALVRGVRYRTAVVPEAAREDVRKLDQAIGEAEKKLRRIDATAAVLVQERQFIDKLEAFVQPIAKLELNGGVLNAETVAGITRFMFESREKLSDRIVDTAETQRVEQEALSQLQTRRAQLTRDRSRAEREAVIFVEKANAADAQVRLTYLVEGSTWSPVYNMRSAGDLQKATVEYNALIQQMSGEDWEDVALTLSTASPNLVSDAPELAPLLVGLTPRGAKQRDRGVSFSDLKAAQAEIANAEQDRRRTTRLEEQVQAQWTMNVQSGNYQVLEYNVKEGPQGAPRVPRAEMSMLSVDYKIPGTVSIASRSDQQIVRIDSLTLPASFVNTAIPLFTEHVYQEAQIENSSEIALLEGQSNVYLDGRFVGRGAVPLVARGQRFTLGFGVDAQLRAAREFVSREEQAQGGNRILTFKYRLVLDNYKKTPAMVRLFDRIPTSQADIKVTLGEMSDPLSADKEYLRAVRPTGILRWDIQVPAGAAGENARIVEYSFKLEFDRNMDITGITSGEKAEAAKEDFEMQMKQKR